MNPTHIIPKVSVIIPNYNHALFLRERMETILGQTRPPDEIIVLDDGSTDGSVSLLSELIVGRANIRLITNSQNSGSTFRQWKKGLREATGDFVWIAESDDASDPRFLETMVGRLEADPTVVLAYCESMVINEQGEQMESVLDWYESVVRGHWSHDFTGLGIDEVREYFTRFNIIPNTSSVVIRRSFISDEDIAAIQTYRYAGDWLLWGRLLIKGNFCYVARPLNYFRTHRGTTRAYKSIKSEFRRYDECNSVIRTLAKASNKPKPWFSMAEHEWLVSGWLRKYYHYRKHIAYFFPPLPAALLPAFYRGILQYFTGAIRRKLS